MKSTDGKRDDLDGGAGIDQAEADRGLDVVTSGGGRRVPTASGLFLSRPASHVATHFTTPSVQGDVLVWWDDAHVTVTSSRLLTPTMLAVLDRTLPSSASATAAADSGAAG